MEYRNVESEKAEWGMLRSTSTANRNGCHDRNRRKALKDSHVSYAYHVTVSGLGMDQTYDIMMMSLIVQIVYDVTVEQSGGAKWSSTIRQWSKAES